MAHIHKLELLIPPARNGTAIGAIAILAQQVIGAIDTAVSHHGIDLKENDWNVLIPIAPKPSPKWGIPSPALPELPDRAVLPITLAAMLPTPSKLTIRFDFHKDATLAILSYRQDGASNNIEIIRESLDNENPTDFFGWLSIAVTVWQIADNIAKKPFRCFVNKRIAFFDQPTRKAYHFSPGNHIDVTSDMLHLTGDGYTIVPANGIHIDPNDKTSSIPRALSCGDITRIAPSAEDKQAHQLLRAILDPFILDGHTGPKDYLYALTGVTEKEDDGEVDEYPTRDFDPPSYVRTFEEIAALQNPSQAPIPAPVNRPNYTYTTKAMAARNNAKGSAQIECTKCQGTGVKLITAKGRIVECETCDGNGRVYPPMVDCRVCGGTGRDPKQDPDSLIGCETCKYTGQMPYLGNAP